MSKIKKVIITGVTGQDGSYMAEYLLNNTDVEVYGMARRSSNLNLTNLSGVIRNNRFKIVTGDLSDSQSIDSMVKAIQPDYFINLAAQSFVGASWQLPEQTFDVDAGGVIRCLEAIRKHSPKCRFYNAGSSEEFGDVQYTPQTESHPLRARSPYGAAKIAARQIVKVWRESYDLYAVQGILFNHESERRGEEFVTRKISKGVARIKKALDDGKGFEPIILGNLESQRDWSHAEDFVAGIWAMLNQEQHNSKIKLASASRLPHVVKEYILSSDETHTIREFIEKAFKVAGIKIADANASRTPPVIGRENAHQVNYLLDSPKRILPVVVVSREFYRPAEVELLHGDSTAVRQDLGWDRKISFDELVARMVKNDIKLLTHQSENS